MPRTIIAAFYHAYGLLSSRPKAAKQTAMTVSTLRIGTRGSPLALKQTAMVEAALRAAHPALEIEQVIIKTSGDWRPEQGEIRLSEEQGGKGLFAHEIERSLQAREIDCAVHSLKDMPSFPAEGLSLDCVMKRGNPCDAFVSYKASSMMDLPQGAVVGTSSLRRQSLILSKRPDLKIVPFRGNVQTRLAKLADGQVDATFLAMAGLERLGIQADFIHMLPVSDMLPACGQATIAIETRKEDAPLQDLLRVIHHEETGLCSLTERAALQTLDGSCHTPIGAYARFENGQMMFDLLVGSSDGRRVFSESAHATIQEGQDAVSFGHSVAANLKARVPSDIFS